jgi:hypothetical protein
MLNARTWHRLCISAYVMFPAIVIAWFLPNDSPLIWPAIVAIIWGFIVAGFGALQGIMLAFGKLHLGCPICDARSIVSGGDREGMYLECPHCGDLRLNVGRLFGLRAIRPGSADDARAPPGAASQAPRPRIPAIAIAIAIAIGIAIESLEGNQP